MEREDPSADTRPDSEPLWREVVGDELRARRHDSGWTLVETARRAGVSPQYLSEMERGTKDASSEMIAAVAGALGLDLLDLTSAVADTLRTRQDASVAVLTRSAVALAA